MPALLTGGPCLPCCRGCSPWRPWPSLLIAADVPSQKQYASCQFQNTSERGAFGDALSEVDWIIGE